MVKTGVPDIEALTNTIARADFNAHRHEIIMGPDKLGLVVVRNVANPTYQVDVDADVLQVGSYTLRGVNLTLDVEVIGENGLEASDAEGASKWYEVYVGVKEDETVIGFLNEAGTAIGTDPTGTGIYRQAGYVKNDAGSDFSTVVNFADHFHLCVPGTTTDFAAADFIHDGVWHANALNLNSFYPPGPKLCKIRLQVKSTVIGQYFYLRQNVTHHQRYYGPHTQVANLASSRFFFPVPCDSDNLLDYRSSLAGVSGGTRRVWISIVGWW